MDIVVSFEYDVAVCTALFYYARLVHSLCHCIDDDETISRILVVALQLSRMCFRQHKCVHISVMIQVFLLDSRHHFSWKANLYSRRDAKSAATLTAQRIMFDRCTICWFCPVEGTLSLQCNLSSPNFLLINIFNGANLHCCIMYHSLRLHFRQFICLWTSILRCFVQPGIPCSHHTPGCSSSLRPFQISRKMSVYMSCVNAEHSHVVNIVSIVGCVDCCRHRMCAYSSPRCQILPSMSVKSCDPICLCINEVLLW